MGLFRLYFDVRSMDKMGRHTIRIGYTKARKTAFFSTEMKCLPEQWDDVSELIVKHPQAHSLNYRLISMLTEAEDLFFANRDEYANRTSAQIVKSISDIIFARTIDQAKNFIPRYKEYMARAKKRRTREIYETTLRHIYRYDRDADRLQFTDITQRWLNGFDTYLYKYSPSVNARNIHFRNIRAVFNDAIDDDVTTYYPFRRFKIKNTETRKRSLSLEQMAQLFAYPVEANSRWYHDYFRLSFYLIGINMHDICYLKRIYDGRIDYNRAKTGRAYSIKVEPEAMEIIERHKGKQYLLDAMDRYSRPQGMTENVNLTLQSLGKVKIDAYGRRYEEPLFPEVTMYWARHTWATIAAGLDIPKETIAAALGHGGKSITDIYIRFDEKKIDEANRKVIDALNAEIKRQKATSK